MSLFLRSSQVLALLLLLTACGGRPRDKSPNPETPALLQVENRGFTDMVVYAVSGGQRVRLGMANGNSTRSFTIPNYLVRGAGRIRFLADPIGGNRSPVSEEMTVHPGDLVTLAIPP